MHGSPYAYDTHVPVMFAGPGITPQRVSRLVAPEDIAPTVAAYLGIAAPSGSVGEILVEVVQPLHPRQPASGHKDNNSSNSNASIIEP